jgi:hypothetical protein
LQPSITYRRILAAVFLLVYIFIATPVQLWHQHNFVKKEKAACTKIAAGTVSISSEDCKICQHTYAVYVKDDVHFTLPAQTILTNTNSFFESRYTEPGIQDTSNKSPPLA